MEHLTPEIISRIKNLLSELESKDNKRIQEAALQVAIPLVGIDHRLGGLDGELREMEELALDLEVPINLVEDYDLKLAKLIKWIKSL